MSQETIYFIYFAAAIVWGIIWGIVVKKVIENKGYYENWFWWGFFFGWIALIVAVTKPAVQNKYEKNTNSLLSRLEEQNSQMSTGEVRSDGWKCVCGKVNPKYVGTCDCGRSLKEIQEIKRKNEAIKNDSVKNVSTAEGIKEFKKLLDMGAITEAEFEAKKKELLNL